MEVMGEHCECHEGWVPLIEDAIRLVRKYNIEHPEKEPLKFFQIKEKWGGLRLYLDSYNVPKEIKEKLRELEGRSFDVCEICGTSEGVETKPSPRWVKSLCPNCRKEYESERRV